MPPSRVSREEIAATHAWVNPGLRSLARGDRAVAGWDEDVVTMAVDASRDCLRGVDRAAVAALFLGSTTAPFADRSNAGIVAEALGLAETAITQDVTGSQRAGTGALRCALDAAAARQGTVLVVAAERRSTPAATTAEMTTGQAAAALLLGRGPGIARLAGSATLNVDFVDHFRPEGGEFDYQWEERWVRDEGYLKIMPRAIKAGLADAGAAAGDVAHFCLPCPLPRVDRQVAKLAGIPEGSVSDGLAGGCGYTGAAHPLLMLVDVLERANPGELVAVCSFGQGADVFVFQVTDAIVEGRRQGGGVAKWLRRARPCSYPKHLALNGLVKIDRGIRAEADKATALSALYRHRDLVNRLVGGRCERCGTYQIPRLRICVNPACRAVDAQAPHSFAESRARVVSWSADTLTYTPDPPAYYGMVDFEEGGRLMVDFSDVDKGGVEVGMPMRMVFRVKDHDAARGFTRYFWKAAPAEAERGN